MTQYLKDRLQHLPFVAVLILCQLLSNYYWLNDLTASKAIAETAVGVAIVMVAIGAAYLRFPQAARRGLAIVGWLLIGLNLSRPFAWTDPEPLIRLGLVLGTALFLVPFSFPQSFARIFPPEKRLPRLAFAAATALTLVAAFYTFENIRWSRKLDRYRQQKVAEGRWIETMADVTPPAVPDEENFAMTPLLRPLLDYDPNKTGGERWNDLAGFERVGKLIPYRNTGHRRVIHKWIGIWGAMHPIQMEVLAEYYRGGTNFPPGAVDAFDLKQYLLGDASVNAELKTGLPLVPSGLAPAETVLLALSHYDAETEEISRALDRPYARFPIHYDEHPPQRILLSHLSKLKGLSVLFRVRATALLHANRINDAFADSERVYRLADTIRNEPFLISHLVRVAIMEIGHNALWEGLRDRRWTAEHLLAFERRLRKTDLLASLAIGLDGERAMTIVIVKDLQHKRPNSRDSRNWIFGRPATREQFYMRFSPSGWFTANILNAGRYLDAMERTLADKPTVKSLSEHESLALREIEPLGAKTFIAQALLLSFKTGTKTVRSVTHRNLALAACALERFYLDKGNYPDTLQQLVPDYLPEVPIDHADGQPLRYLRSADGRYRVYSIGNNLLDEGGRVTAKFDLNQGDWVWGYQPEFLEE